MNSCAPGSHSAGDTPAETKRRTPAAANPFDTAIRVLERVRSGIMSTNQTHAEDANVGASFSVRGKYVAPTGNQAVQESDVVTKVTRQYVAIERMGLPGWRRLGKCQVPLLARHDVECAAQAFKV